MIAEERRVGSGKEMGKCCRVERNAGRVGVGRGVKWVFPKSLFGKKCWTIVGQAVFG